MTIINEYYPILYFYYFIMVVVRTGIEIAFNFFFYMLYEDPVINQNIINALIWEWTKNETLVYISVKITQSRIRHMFTM